MGIYLSTRAPTHPTTYTHFDLLSPPIFWQGKSNVVTVSYANRLLLMCSFITQGRIFLALCQTKQTIIYIFSGNRPLRVDDIFMLEERI